MTAATDELIEAARAVTIADAAERLGLAFARRGQEHPQPCPACGGRDRFSFNTAKNNWVCRGAGAGGGDAIGMAAHVRGLDTSRRAEFLEACSIAAGLPVPDDAERESEADRAARLARIAARRRANAEEAARRERDASDFREKERARARGIYSHAEPLGTSDLPYGRFYLKNRCGGFPPVPPDERTWLRVAPEVTYWHGKDERGDPVALHCGPAMIAAFIASRRAPAADAACGSGGAAWLADARSGLPPLAEGYDVIGCHITWIDLDNPPKFRPLITDPETGEILPTKKMRGSKKGGLIPIAGDPAARRWLGGEGIENVAALGRAEGWRGDTFYFAAGDLGNLAGPADPASRFAHPTLTRPDKNGVERPVMVAGPVPRADQGPEDAMAVPEHVDELILLADGDSEPVFTAAAMVRAKARHARPGRLIPVVWPVPGTDFAELLAGKGEQAE
ncbi:primase-helicase zinc-binding domain-containing protein [Aquibium oceanicum]|uniref:DNA primase/helicase Gp4 N-terminal Bacteriophage T7-like domain-containing protein n=1 Tax=Aquibium oceanicum TaxID=1670800 RepID=A0A1L3SPT3_9HYPH|nr:primase-helicase zinc-binding domain-containing protein [Aquibium oceanicum]APH71433.1 hypothetical protein BSQ44_08675 [Aquibium oceanicum]